MTALGLVLPNPMQLELFPAARDTVRIYLRLTGLRRGSGAFDCLGADRAVGEAGDPGNGVQWMT